jgi:hypothetical protein
MASKSSETIAQENSLFDDETIKERKKIFDETLASLEKQFFNPQRNNPCTEEENV